jgi:hypothetical protein
MKEIIDLIQSMGVVEDAACQCSNCKEGTFCGKHDKAFWELYDQLKEKADRWEKQEKITIKGWVWDHVKLRDIFHWRFNELEFKDKIWHNRKTYKGSQPIEIIVRSPDKEE